MRCIWTIALLYLLAGCSSPPYPRGSLDELYPTGERPQLHTVHVLGRTIRVADLPGKGSRPLVLIHGSPGGWTAWARYLDAPALASYGPRMAVDRPGFGGSAEGGVMPDLRHQAELLAATLPDGPPAILVGHSLGGPLVAWMAIDHPDKVCGAVLVAGSVAPELEAPRWYNQVADTWLASLVVPTIMMRSNQEMMPLQAELVRLDLAWSKLRRPLVAIQGGRDSLVDPLTADYLERRAPPEWTRVVRAANADHFQLWTQPEAVIREILSLPCK
ncbi:MAG: alpha/beta hydrolase [Rhodoferax sp.]|nr:alpha/beta hydrolase [Rhodoferax sp.]